jgi:PIN like domain
VTERVPSLDEARFFVDEDLSGFGIALMRLRRDVIVGRHAPAIEVVPKDDPDWIPMVAARGWVVITNDRRIRTRPGEADQARDVGLLCVCLRPTVKDATPWDFMVMLARHWSRVEQLVGRKDPAWLELRGDRAYERPYQPGQPPRLPSGR